MNYKPSKKVSLLAHDILSLLLVRTIENPIVMNELKMFFHPIIKRELELAIEELRAAGVPVCSSCRKPYGYYLPRNYAEALPWVQQIQHRHKVMAANMHRAIASVKALAMAEGVQTNIFDNL